MPAVHAIAGFGRFSFLTGSLAGSYLVRPGQTLLPTVGSSGDHSGSTGRYTTPMRAYELMLIFTSDTEESDVQQALNRLTEQAAEAGATVEKVDKWGLRRFAYEINHKTDGFYVVLELLAPTILEEVDRTLRLADNVVRHKFMRLPLKEAHRRGLAAATA